MKNIFADIVIDGLTNSVVRYGANAYMERMFSFKLCSEIEVTRSRPPYKANNRLLELDFSEHPLDSSSEGRFPIQDDLEWNVIGEAFDGFIHYENGGLDANGKKFMQPYFKKYGKEFNQQGFAVAAAIKFIKDIGWNKTTGRANDGSTEWATFEEKYTWIAVHRIQGYLADRLPYGKFEPEGMLTNYGEILNIPNPAEFGVGHVIVNYHLGADKWLIPEDIAEPIPLTPLASPEDIKSWASRPLLPQFKQWIELKNQHLSGIHDADDDWITLYSTTALPEPNCVGRTRLTLNCVLISTSKLVELKEFVQNPSNRFAGNHGMRPDDMSSSVSHGINHSLLDVIWMDKYDDDEPEKWISNQHNRGYQVKSTITVVNEVNLMTRSDIYEVPSALLRKAFNIKTTDKRGFFDADDKLKFLMYRRWEDIDTEQKVTLVDRKSFEGFLITNSLSPIWIAENFRSTIANSKNKKKDDHWQNCTKWIVWNDNYSHFEFHNNSHC